MQTFSKRAMVFAAGLGTRLQPLTNDRPKALVEANGITLLELTLRKLDFFGFREIVVNIHHFGDQIIDFLQDRQNFGLTIHISDERALLLNTGGGLKRAARWLQDGPFLVHNTDIISDLDLNALYGQHIRNGALATLAVRTRESSRHLLFNKAGIMAGWRNNRTGETRFCRPDSDLRPFAFSGIHVISPEIFGLMPEEDVFSIIDVYLSAGREHEIRAFPHEDGFWFDVGKIPSLERAAPYVAQLRLAK